MAVDRVAVPKRLLKRRFWPAWAIGAVVLAAFLLTAWSLRDRTNSVDSILKAQQELIYENCVSNETQDSVIVAQLQAAKVRARASLPAGSPVLRTQLQVLSDGIAALEPPDEADCEPPEGTQP
jgi:hypothetical protein